MEDLAMVREDPALLMVPRRPAPVVPPAEDWADDPEPEDMDGPEF